MGRGYHAFNALGAAGVILLLADPAQLYSVGFQLSFTAVGGILGFAPLWRRAIDRVSWSLLRSPLRLLGVSLAATLGTAPVTMSHFGYVTGAGVPLNLVGVPAMSALLASSLVSLALIDGPSWMWAPPISCASLAGWLLRALVVEGDRMLSEWLMLEWRPSGAGLTGLVALLLAGIIGRRRRVRDRILVLGLSVLTFGFWSTLLERGSPTVRILFFDTGQGDAVLIRTPDERHVLVDGGPVGFGTDSGRRILLPHLRRFGIDRIDLVVVTHPHRDHAGGLLTVMRHVDVGMLLHNGHRYDSSLMDEIFHVADSLGIPRHVVRAGARLRVDRTVRIQVLAPDRVPRPHEDPNVGSLILRIVHGATKAILTGDAVAVSERRVVDRFGPILSAGVVQVPHHGSRTSSSQVFIRAVGAGRPRCASEREARRLGCVRAIVTVGRTNRYGLPDGEVLGRWRSVGIPVATTAERGAISVGLVGDRVRVDRWRPSWTRYR